MLLYFQPHLGQFLGDQSQALGKVGWYLAEVPQGDGFFMFKDEFVVKLCTLLTGGVSVLAHGKAFQEIDRSVRRFWCP
jgi:hypothetical protein